MVPTGNKQIIGAHADIKALLFDLGGVVMDIDFMHAVKIWAKHASCDAVALAERFHFDGNYEQHERGEKSGEQFYRDLVLTLDISISYQQFLNGWNAIFNHIVPEVEPVLLEMSKRYPVFGFSNTNLLHHEYWSGEYASILRYFKQMFLSYQLGMRKPEVKAFHFVVQQMGVVPEQVLFFDDTDENVTAAHELGINAIHVRCADDITGAIKRYCQQSLRKS